MTALSEPSYAMFSHQSDAEDFVRYTDSNVIFTSGPMDVSIPADAFGFQQQNASQDAFASSMGFVEPTLFTEAPNYMLNSRASPSMYTDESSDMRLPSSSLSTASAPSTTSSAIGSPQSNHGQMGAMPEWAPQGLGLQPAIVGNDYIGSDFASFPSSGMEGMEELSFDFPVTKAFVGKFKAISYSLRVRRSPNPLLRNGIGRERDPV
ncbi:Zinc finger protein PLAG1 [Fusarium austroafricanum]|uniref:Zinc finger protein PLAG1 n=1 Tax=Fusarium austroafricanum TaxID=2364996 RepID=A0A8H4KMG8_9HYPO|nr:Zinc finger protein PLAG1 [Fusarium austroafricanum]